MSLFKKLTTKDLRWTATKSPFLNVHTGNETFGEFTFNFGITHYLIKRTCLSFTAYHNKRVCDKPKWNKYYYDTEGAHQCTSEIFKKIKWDYTNG